MRLDERLSLAFTLYDSCGLAADIGTDHAHLPIALLRAGKCRRMILTDISGGAIQNARDNLIRAGLTDAVSLRQGDGLAPVDEACGMISVLGMGGKTIRAILEAGRDHLRGANLLLSAHTDLPEVREAVQGIGYRLISETPCFSAGRFYLMLKAAPGAERLTEREIRLGKPLFETDSPALPAYLRHQLAVLARRAEGLRGATLPDDGLRSRTEEDMAFYRERLAALGAD
ncbi:MAG: SAM-dependent methyltransferase [Clostridia bacterium]|nr:SAM-dependent methyltransferase [Clostridia bacterium]